MIQDIIDKFSALHLMVTSIDDLQKNLFVLLQHSPCGLNITLVDDANSFFFFTLPKAHEVFITKSCGAASQVKHKMGNQRMEQPRIAQRAILEAMRRKAILPGEAIHIATARVVKLPAHANTCHA